MRRIRFNIWPSPRLTKSQNDKWPVKEPTEFQMTRSRILSEICGNSSENKTLTERAQLYQKSIGDIQGFLIAKLSTITPGADPYDEYEEVRTTTRLPWLYSSVAALSNPIVLTLAAPRPPFRSS